jgi:glycosyltransferase involved in cell wall biosynthesis
MWPETLSATGIFTSDRGAKLLAALARFVYRQAAAITVISPGFKLNLIEKGVPAEKVHVISNWADEEIFTPLVPDLALAQAHGLVGKFNVVFAGNMGVAQGLDNLLGAAAKLSDLAALQFVLIGDGVDVQRLKSQVQQRSLTNIKFIDRQPVTQMAYFFALADALLVHLRRDPLFEMTIPSKTIAYLACGRPIITVAEGDAAKVVRDAGAGLTCSPGDPVALASTVRTLFRMSPEERGRMGEAGRRAYLSHYTRRVLMDRYEALLSEVAALTRPRPGLRLQ